MTERYGTIFQILKTKAIRHLVPQSSWETFCGLNLYRKIPDKWGDLLKPGWNNEHMLPKEDRCKKCYPNQRRKKRS